jgi:hypothetical protein
MPVQNAKARWVDRTIAEAQATARDIMRKASPLVFSEIPPTELRAAIHSFYQWDHYLSAGFHAGTILASAVAMVEHLESTP